MNTPSFLAHQGRDSFSKISEIIDAFSALSQLNLNVRTGLKKYTEGLAKEISENFPVDLNEIYEQISTTKDPQTIVNRVLPIIKNIGFFEASIRNDLKRVLTMPKSRQLFMILRK